MTLVGIITQAGLSLNDDRTKHLLMALNSHVSREKAVSYNEGFHAKSGKHLKIEAANTALAKKPAKKLRKIEPLFTKKDIDLATYLETLINTNYPYVKRPTLELLERWANDINKLYRIDKRPYELINAVIEWSQNDSFWKQNIRSAAKLREKFDTMLVRIDEQRKASPL